MNKRFLSMLIIMLPVLVSCTRTSSGISEGKHEEGANSIRILSVEQDSEISLPVLIKELVEADYVLLGEAHDNPAHHKLQQKLLKSLVDAGRKPAVVFEMFNREDDGIIATTSRRYPSDPDRIATAVNWAESGWPDWCMYRPIVKTALDAGLQVVAGNLSRVRLRELIFHRGLETFGERALMQMGLFEPLTESQKLALRDKIASAHGGGEIPSSLIAGMVMAQRMRDATLAEAMIARNLGQGAVLIAGREHVRNDYGVPHYLRYREPEARIVSVAFVEPDKTRHGVATQPPAGTGLQQYDFVWVQQGVNSLRTAHQ